MSAGYIVAHCTYEIGGKAVFRFHVDVVLWASHHLFLLWRNAAASSANKTNQSFYTMNICMNKQVNATVACFRSRAVFAFGVA